MLPLLNRNFQLPGDHWYHIVPMGEYPHPSGVLQVIDQAAVQAMENRFKADAAKENFPGILVDFDHFSDDPDKTSAAAGWIEEVQNRDNGLWGRIRWSGSGKTAVENGDYRLVSPVWLPKEMEPVDSKTVSNSAKKRLRPLRLHKLALTNDPNLKGMVPLSNRAGSDDPTADKPAPATRMSKLTELLKLSADATEDQIVASVTSIQNRASSLEAENKTLLADQVEADLAKYANRIKPEAKDKLKAQLLKNRASTIELLEIMPEIKPDDTKPPMHNRSTASTPADAIAVGKAKARRDQAIDAYRLANRCSYQDAWSAVQQREPELFTQDK